MRKITNKDINIVKSIAGRYEGYSWDDLVGEGCIGLVSALTKFSGDREHEFAYVYSSINNAMLNYIKKRNRHDDRMTCESMEFELADQLNPEETMIRKEILRTAKDKAQEILTILSLREQYVMFCHILGDEPETLRSIAIRFRCSKDSILRDKKRILEQFLL